jgi:hypothetical protein
MVHADRPNLRAAADGGAQALAAQNERLFVRLSVAAGSRSSRLPFRQPAGYLWFALLASHSPTTADMNTGW